MRSSDRSSRLDGSVSQPGLTLNGDYTDSLFQENLDLTQCQDLLLMDLVREFRELASNE